MLQGTREVVIHWLNTYGTPRTKSVPHAADLSQTPEAEMVTDPMRFDSVN